MSFSCRLGLLILTLALIITAGIAQGQSPMTDIAKTTEDTTIAIPTGLVSRAGDRSVILHWDPIMNNALAGYHVYRSTSSNEAFERRNTHMLETHHFVDFDVENGHSYYYRVQAVDKGGLESSRSAAIATTPNALDDEAFLTLLQQTAFDYFWYEANPENGLIPDRSQDWSPANIAGVGFALTALTVGIDRGWISREAGRERVHKTLKFLWNSPQGPETYATGYKGFYYHYLDMKTGRRTWESELSTVDTALLLSGVLHSKQFFDQDNVVESDVRALADAIYRRVEWPWMQVRAPMINHGWTPGVGFLPYDWSGYNEAMLVYLLALGSPTFPVNQDAWNAWTSTYDWQTHYDFNFVATPPLFVHQYPHVWIDFRGIRDLYMHDKGIDYFENSRRATLANRAYAVANPKGWAGYGDDIWGLTASDNPTGYLAHGAPPAEHDNGTIAPTAAGGSFAFTPTESLTALRRMYQLYRTRLWGPYGFRDAFNPHENWFATDYIAINQGPIVLMIENYRTGRIWNVAMRETVIQHGLKQAGFFPVLKQVAQSTVPADVVLEAKSLEKQ